MKVKELNRLLNNMKKQDPEADITLGLPTLFGPAFPDPEVIEGKDGVYIVPKGSTEALKEDCSRADVGQCLSEWEKEYRDQQSGAAGTV